MTRLVITCLVLLLASMCAMAAETQIEDSNSWVLRVVYAGKRLWVLEEGGKLSSVEDGKDVRVGAGLKDPVLDLWLRNGTPTVITQRKGAESYTVRTLAGRKWVTLATVPSRGDQLFAAGSHGDGTALVTEHHLIEIDTGGVKSFPLSWGRVGGIPTVLVMQNSVLVGMNAGEWGGGLRVIDRRSGAMSTIDCAYCSPVTGMAPEPAGKPDCAIVSIGIIHLLESGDLVEVCGATARKFYERPKTQEMAGRHIDVTTPFFAVSSAGGRIRAVGDDGIYRIEADGQAEDTPMPRFQAVGGLYLSFAIPDVVLVLTDINAHQSLSGRTPLLVAR